MFGPGWSARRLAQGRTAALLILIAIVAGVLARIQVQADSPVFASDTFQSLLIARSLLDGRGFDSEGAEHPDLSRSILFPVAIAGVTALVGDVELGARIVVVLSGALIVIPLFFVARSAFGPTAALATLPLGALSCEVGSSARLLSTPLFVLFSMNAITLTWSGTRHRSRWRWIAAGLACGLAALARPEGLVIVLAVSLWAVLDPILTRRFSVTGLRSGAVCTGLVIAAFVAAYGPYVVWVSWKLGRFAPAPGIAYVQSERAISDHLKLREMASPVPWTARARFMLCRDHRSLYLATYFLTGAFPEPDAELQADPTDSAAVSESTHRRASARRRFFLMRGNLMRVPKKAIWGHFAPPIIVALSVVGLALAAMHRRSRHASLLLFLSGVAALAPLANHIEDRFFFLPFAVALPFAAAGWAGIHAWRGWNAAGPAIGRATRVGFSALVAVLVGWAGYQHDGVRTAAIERAELLQVAAPAVTAGLPPGPALSIDPHFAYWTGRSYLPIPFASPSAILEFARAHGAVELALEGTRDLRERPDLEWLLSENRPAAWHLLRDNPHPEGGRLLVFRIDPDPPPNP